MMSVPVLPEPILDWSLIGSGAKLALEAYKNRQLLHDLWSRAMIAAGIAQIELMVTGPGGVGKTLLLDRLADLSGKLGYEKPGFSSGVELRAVPVGGFSRLVQVLPGQAWRAFESGLKEGFESPGLNGLMYVVANGFVSPRREESRVVLEAEIRSLHQYCALQREEEASHFSRISGMIRQRVSEGKKAPWICVVVNKADLYWSERDDVYRRYAPGGTGPFSRELNSLINQLGSLNCRIAVVPAVAWTEDFEWSMDVRASQLRNEAERRAINANLLATLGWLATEN